MRTVSKTVYTFDELSDRAKEKARDWWRDCAQSDTFEAEYHLEDIGRIVGALGGTFDEKRTYYSVGFTQSDGAAIQCRLNARSVLAAIDSNALADIAPDFAAQMPKAPTVRPMVRALLESSAIEVYCDGSATHLGNQSVDEYHHVYSGHDCVRLESLAIELEEWLTDIINDLAHYLYTSIRDDIEWQNEDEQVDEMLRINEYEFNKDGSIA